MLHSPSVHAPTSSMHCGQLMAATLLPLLLRTFRLALIKHMKPLRVSGYNRDARPAEQRDPIKFLINERQLRSGTELYFKTSFENESPISELAL